MLPMAALGIVGDQYYLNALKYKNLKYFQIAKEVFPFNKNLLIGDAEYYVIFGVVNKESYEAIKRMVYYDPYRPRHLSLQMQYAFILGDSDVGVDSFNKLKKLAPNMYIVKEILKRNSEKDILR